MVVRARAASLSARMGLHRVDYGANYSDEQLRFLQAVDRWKRRHGVVFPTWVEIFEIFRGLGYRLPAENGKGN